jgi:hypothetical protein
MLTLTVGRCQVGLSGDTDRAPAVRRTLGRLFECSNYDDVSTGLLSDSTVSNRL